LRSILICLTELIYHQLWNFLNLREVMEIAYISIWYLMLSRKSWKKKMMYLVI
jgi:hypothetical protein